MGYKYKKLKHLVNHGKGCYDHFKIIDLTLQTKYEYGGNKQNIEPTICK